MQNSAPIMKIWDPIMQNSDPILTKSRNDYSYGNHLFREFVIISIEGVCYFYLYWKA